MCIITHYYVHCYILLSISTQFGVVTVTHFGLQMSYFLFLFLFFCTHHQAMEDANIDSQ